jgi:hypothetical protein
MPSFAWTLHGGWTQTTSGSGTDTIACIATIVIQRADGSVQNSSMPISLGVHNDHGGPADQEWPVVPLFIEALAAGERAELVISCFGTSNGGFWQHLAQAGPVAIGAAVGALADPGLGAVAGAATNAIIQAAIQQNPNYAGSIRSWAAGAGGWDMLPANNAALHPPMPDPGTNTRATYSFALNAGGRPEYWPKLQIQVT